MDFPVSLRAFSAKIALLAKRRQDMEADTKATDLRGSLAAASLVQAKPMTGHPSATSQIPANDELQARQRLALRRQQRSSQAAGHSVDRVQADNAQLTSQLTQEVLQLETSARAVRTGNATSTGCPDMDRCLPHSGYPPGSVIEYLKSSVSCGASYLALAAAAEAMKKTDGFMVLVDRQKHIYPPALTAQGIDLKKVIFVHPETTSDTIWAIDQAARTSAVAAVFADVQSLDDRAARRLQLAAEAGGGLVLLLRSLAARGAPSWAEVQWSVRALNRPRTGGESTSSTGPSPLQQFQQRRYLPESNTNGAGQGSQRDRWLQVHLLRNRGSKAGTRLELTIDAITGRIRSSSAKTTPSQSTVRERNRHEEKGAVHLATQLASPANPSRRAASG